MPANMCVERRPMLSAMSVLEVDEASWDWATLPTIMYHTKSLMSTLGNNSQ
jgi:hypothetical protein